MKKVLSLILCAALVLSLTACAGKSEPDETAPTSTTAPSASKDQNVATPTETAPQSVEPIELTIFADFQSSGIHDDEVTKRIKEATGVTLVNVSGDAQKLKILAAGGDLPDIISLHEAQDLAPNLISSGAILPLDDLLDNYGKNIKEIIPTALKWSKEIIGDGKTYFIPTSVQKPDTTNPKQNGFVGFYTRWDIYKAIGAPEIKSEDDYLNVLKMMQDYQPTTEDGKKVYALSGWTDWGLWPYEISYPFMYAWSRQDNGQMLNLETGEQESQFLEEDGIFWQGLKFFNKAYRMGIFDPEGFTMKAGQYGDKVKSGAVLVGYGDWQQPDVALTNSDAANYLLPGAFPYFSGVYTDENLLGYKLNNSIAISSRCKYPERAMQVLDFLNTTEGARTIYNGAKGVDWDVTDGKPQLTGKLLRNFMSGGSEEADYLLLDSVSGIARYSYFTCLTASTQLGDGYPADLRQDIEYKLQAARPVARDFAQYYGGTDAVYPGQAYAALIAAGKVKTTTKTPIAPSLAKPVSDESRRIFTSANEYFNSNIARIIMAKSDEEFAAQKKSAIEDVKAMGLEEAQAEADRLLEEAKETAKIFN